MKSSVLGVLRSCCVTELFLGRYNTRICSPQIGGPQQTKGVTPLESILVSREFY